MRCPVCSLTLDPEPQAAMLHVVLLHADKLRDAVANVFEGVATAPPKASEEEE